MSQALPHLLQAMLKGLIVELQASDAAVVLPDSSAIHPHLLVRVGRLTMPEWHAILEGEPEELLSAPLRSHGSNGRDAHLCVYRPGKKRWSKEARLATNAISAAVDYLLDTPDDNFDWMQIVASRRILSVTEEELCRIVLDIHDGPVQKLFAAMNFLVHTRAVLERGPATIEAASLVPEIRQITELLEASLSEIRTFLGAFQSAELAERNLLDVLEALVLQHEQLTNSTVHFEAPTSLPPVSMPVKIALYRILQEALSNIFRHARVPEAFVRISAPRDHIHLSIVDHGRGFTPPALSGPGATEAAQHIGLRGMRDRVYLVGGTMDLKSAPGEGTTIQVSVPIS